MFSWNSPPKIFIKERKIDNIVWPMTFFFIIFLRIYCMNLFVSLLSSFLCVCVHRTYKLICNIISTKTVSLLWTLKGKTWCHPKKKEENNNNKSECYTLLSVRTVRSTLLYAFVCLHVSFYKTKHTPLSPVRILSNFHYILISITLN